MGPDAQQLLAAAQATGVPVVGLTIADPVDASTWIIDPDDLSDTDRAKVVQALTLALNPPAPPAAPKTTVDVVDFLKLVTDEEWAAFAQFAATNASFARAKAILDHVLTITPTDGYFVQMLTAAVAIGVLTPDRATAIQTALTARLA